MKSVILKTLPMFLVCSVYASNSLVEGVRPRVLKNEIVKFTPVAGHHFSSEAPQKCGSGSMVEKSTQSISCQFVVTGESKITINVCDDKKTFCKPIEMKVQVSENTSPQKVLSPLKKEEIESLRKQLVPGFIEGNVSFIKAEARKKNEPVFVMISTEWCPPCNETKEYLFNTKTFKVITEKWLKVYVDGDSLEAASWERVIPYNAFPTMVLLNSKFEEVGRFNKELREFDFKSWSIQQLAFMGDKSIPQLKSQFYAKGSALTKDEQVRLLNWALDASQTQLISDLRSKIGSVEQELEIRLLGYDLYNKYQSESESDKAKKKDLLVRLLNLTATADDFEDYMAQLCGISAADCRKYLPQLENRFDVISKWSRLNASEMASAIGESAFTQSEIYSELGDVKKAALAANRCADEFEKQMKTSMLKVSRSSNQARTHCLDLAGRETEAEKLTQEMIASYPNEPTFLIRMAKLKKKAKKLDEALSWTLKAEKLAYGYNWYSAMLLKAQIEIDQKKKAEAKKTLTDTLAKLELPKEKDLRNHLVLQRIRSLEQSLEKVVK